MQHRTCSLLRLGRRPLRWIRADRSKSDGTVLAYSLAASAFAKDVFSETKPRHLAFWIGIALVAISHDAFAVHWSNSKIRFRTIPGR